MRKEFIFFLVLLSWPWFPLNSLRGFLVYASSKRPARYLHSHGHFKQRKPIKDFQVKNVKSIPKSEKDVEAKTLYMRDTILKVYNILKYSTWDSAQDQLRDLPIKWDSYMVNQVLKTHPPMEKSWLFFNWVAGARVFKHDQFTCTTMLDIFGEARRVPSMRFVFEQMREKGMEIDAVTWTSVMHWVSESGDVDAAVKVWEEMRSSGCSPTVVSYTAYMKILLRANRENEAAKVYEEMLRNGLSPNCHTYTVLMDYLIGTGKCKEALDIFAKMQAAKVYPDKAACNILVEKLSKFGKPQEISEILNYMKENFIVLRYPIFLKALEAFRTSGESDLLLRQVNRHCLIKLPGEEDSIRIAKPDEKHFTVDEELILYLMRKENFLATDLLLSEIADKNIKLDQKIVSTVIEVNCDRGRLGEAIWAFDYSIENNIKVSRNSYLALLGALNRSNSYPKIVEVLDEMIKAGHCIGIYLASILIHKLARARKPKLASRVFNLLPSDHKCASTYSALIGAYFLVGNFDKGLEIFWSMETKGVGPCLGTYNLVLCCLERSGRVSEVEALRKKRNKLQIDHGRGQNVTRFADKICDLLFIGNPVL